MQMLGCLGETERQLRQAGLRPTRQRLALTQLIFGPGDRHLTAEQLHTDVVKAGVNVSLATIYNTLHQFTDAGLLRVLAVEGSKTYFDTNTSDHHHFYDEANQTLSDIDSNELVVDNLPNPPEGMEIANVDVIVRLRPKVS